MESNAFDTPVLPRAMRDGRSDDYINLIDLWIGLIPFKRIFLKTFLLVFALGAVLLGVWHQEEYSLTSVIQIGSVQLNGEIVPLESSEALRGKLVNAIVPGASTIWRKRSKTDEHFDTEIELVVDSDVVIIRNETNLGEVDFFTSFQQHVVEKVIQEHRSKALVYQSGTRSALNAARLRLEVLENRQTLNARLKLIDQEIAQERSNLKALESASFSSVGGSPLTSVQPDASDNSANIYQAAIRELELRKIELENQHSEVLVQQKSMVQDLERALQDINHSSVIAEPVLSLEPVNLSLPKFFAILAVVAGVLASLVTLIALFNAKVEQRRAELAG